MNLLARDSSAEPRVESDAHSQSQLEPRYVVLIHNDDVTPYDYVILTLRTIFRLSHELAEHITWVAHTTGIAQVVILPRHEAEKLVSRAHAAAQLDGYPLRFSVEPEG